MAAITIREEGGLKVGICSWNVGNTAPPADVSAWLAAEHGELGSLDLIAVGTQECRFSSPHEGSQTQLCEGGDGASVSSTDLASSTGGLRRLKVVQQTDKIRGTVFWQAVEDSLPAGRYKLVAAARRMEMHLHVYARNDIVPHVAKVRTSNEATGLAGMVGNKGGVGVSLVYYPDAGENAAAVSASSVRLDRLATDYGSMATLAEPAASEKKAKKKKKTNKDKTKKAEKTRAARHGLHLAFVASHLAAHQGHVDKRNADYYEICAGLRAGLGRSKKWGLTTEFDHLFWFGDLNYRVDLPFDVAFPLAERASADDVRQLYAHDQLQHVLDARQAFVGFVAPVPSFPPTYRMKKGVAPAAYDPNLQRVPSWCDRVLTKSAPLRPLRCLEFVSCPSVTTSDHTPVRAVYHLLPTTTDDSATAATAAAPLEVRVSNMRGAGLRAADKNGLSDPYLSFCAPGYAASASAHSSVISKTLEPDWRDEVVVIRLLPDVQRQHLATALLGVRVMDKDTLSKDDRLGEFRVPIVDGDVTANVDYNGHQIGTISFTIHIQ